MRSVVVIKGRARGGPAALATHLERRDTNEKVCVRELRGVTARDVRGALREMDCMGAGAISTRTLYHAAINTSPDERLTDAQKRHATERLAQELGFKGQPRIVVEHLKKDREHIHVVFLRIDTDRMVAIPDSHNYRKHEIVARDLEREFGHQHVQGAHVGREEGQERPNRTPGHDEMQQAERTGVSPQDAKRRITELWNRADSGKAFAAALETHGWLLAKGDRRDFVLVDSAGETHSLARRIEGVNAAEVRQRMSDIDAASLLSVADARAMQRSQANSGRAKEKEKTKANEATQQPIMLKVEAPVVEHDPARPLSIRDGEAAATEKRRAPAPTEFVSKRKPEPQSKPGPLKKLYTAATDVTQRAYAKVRRVFERKEKPGKPVEPKAPRRSVAAPVPSAVTPTQAATAARRQGARQDNRQTVKGTIIEPKTAPPPKPPGPVPANQDRERGRTRDIKPRLSREELDQMIARQRRHRAERGGPSR